MIATRLSTLAFAAVLGASATAYAQSPPSPPSDQGGMASHTWAPGSHMRHERRQAARLKALHEALNIRPDQEGAFQAFSTAITRGEEGPRPQEMEMKRQEMAGLSTPERLDAMGRMMDEHMARMRERFQRHAAAVKTLYAALSPDQRRTFDALPDLAGHGMGMGMGSHGDMDHHGMERPGMERHQPGMGDQPPGAPQ